MPVQRPQVLEKGPGGLAQDPGSLTQGLCGPAKAHQSLAQLKGLRVLKTYSIWIFRGLTHGDESLAKGDGRLAQGPGGLEWGI